MPRWFGAGVETWRLGVARRCFRTAGVRPVVPAGRFSIEAKELGDGTELVEKRTRFDARSFVGAPVLDPEAVGLTGEIASAARRLGRRRARGGVSVASMTLKMSCRP